MVLLVLSVILIVFDRQAETDSTLSKVSSLVRAPFQWLSSVPSKTIDDFDNTFVTRERLIAENESLSNESLILQAKVQKLVSLTAENVRLRELLSSSTLLEDTVLVAEIIGVAPNIAEAQDYDKQRCARGCLCWSGSYRCLRAGGTSYGCRRE